MKRNFFNDMMKLFRKKKIRIEDWTKQFSKLMQDLDIRKAWLAFSSDYPFLSDYFKHIPQYKNQLSMMNGRSFGGKLNLYALFTEQCFHLIKNSGECGIVIPSGIYTDLGTKRLRELLFEETLVTRLFCFENSKEIFENVHRSFKFVVLRIARNTDARTAIATVIPPRRFCADTAQTTRNIFPGTEMIFLTGVFNSFVADWEIRLRVTAHMDMHFVYSMHIPRLTHGDKWFKEIVSRAARLICTSPEFDDLAREIGIPPLSPLNKGGGVAGGISYGVTDPIERAKLRAELDGIIAHLYELTEDEFAYILTTFPLVAQPVKEAALEQYRFFAPKSCDEEVLALIKAGESHSVEFKETARWDAKQNLYVG